MLQAQPAMDSLELETAVVVAPRETEFNAGTYTYKADSMLMAQYRNSSLGDLLGQQSGAFIRTFTPGSLATPLMRGTYGIHTAVVWNGFTMQSPMNQLIDLNLIPAFFIDGVSLGYGSHSGLYGSGAIGGTISLGQQTQEKDGVHGTFIRSNGSFENYQQGAKISFKKGWYTGRVRYFNQIAQNNYTYINKTKAKFPEEQLSNAHNWQNGQLFENYFRISYRTKASLIVWHQQADRGVPPKMTQNKSVANQKDDLWRIMGDVKYKAGRKEAIFRASFFDERIRYNDALANPKIDADNRAFGFVTEAELRYHITWQHFINVGINNSYYKSTAGDYGSPSPVQYRPALFISYRYISNNKKLQVATTIRQEAVTLRNKEEQPLVGLRQTGKFKLLPFIPSLGADYNFIKYFWWSGKISKLYRYPHFNDLYWNPGGNPNLLAENGYSTETRLAVKKQTKNWVTGFSAGGYYNDINNWILWQQGIGGIWSPINLRHVKARGMEADGNIEYRGDSAFAIGLDFKYTYTKSTNENKIGVYDDSYKKQLVYIPHHTAVGNITLRYKKFNIRVNSQYTGFQYIQSDNSAILPGFFTLNTFVGHSIQIDPENELVLTFQARNITGETYMVTEWLPMPGRNYLLTLLLNFTIK